MRAGRFWARPAPCLPYSLNDTNHSATTHDSISSGIMCGGCLLQTLQCLPALSRLETAKENRDTNTRGFSYWLDGMPVCSVCCLIALIVFVSPPKANTKESAVYDCLEIRSVEREICFIPERSVCLEWFTALVMTLELFPLLFLHTAHTILLPHIKTRHYKDNVREEQR